jgi:CsoR family transcriptional regulator, copper-sensing transcriptional repressor
VLVASLASIPAMFLSVVSGVWGTAGHVVDVVSGAVLVAETIVLLVVAEDRRAWIRGHVGLIALTLLVVVAVVFAIGPVQVLRLARTVGALRVLRAGRIVKAARVVRQHTGFSGPLVHVFSVGAGLLVAAFVGVVLADPTSRSHFLLERVIGEVSTPVVVLASVAAGLLLGGATFLLARDGGSGADAEDDEVREDPPAERPPPGGSSTPDPREPG